MNLRCAIYARFSSDRQSPSSITDRIRKCREYAAQQGWTVLDSYVYSDEAVAATEMDRNGLQSLLAAATADSVRRFGCILIDDSSRHRSMTADNGTVRLERDPAESETVRRISELYRSGQSLKRIA
jgi:DNA invertase Pin-like site-specific DNA recombinase